MFRSMRLFGFGFAAIAAVVLAGCADKESSTLASESSVASGQESSPPTPTDEYTGDGLGESPPPDDPSPSSSAESTDESSADEGCIPVGEASAVSGLSLDVTSLSDGIIRDCIYEDLDQIGWTPVFVRLYSADHPEVASWEPAGQPPSDNTRGVYGVDPTLVDGKDRSVYGSEGQCSVVTRSPSRQSMAMITVYDDSVSELPRDPCEIGQELADRAESLPPVE